MQLKFYAKNDLLVPVPEVILIVGAPHKYVGRHHDPSTRSYPANELPDSYDSESREGKRLKKLVRREQCLFPANKETAQFCGVPFVNFTYDISGEWKCAK